MNWHRAWSWVFVSSIIMAVHGIFDIRHLDFWHVVGGVAQLVYAYNLYRISEQIHVLAETKDGS